MSSEYRSSMKRRSRIQVMPRRRASDQSGHEMTNRDRTHVVRVSCSTLSRATMALMGENTQPIAVTSRNFTIFPCEQINVCVYTRCKIERREERTPSAASTNRQSQVTPASTSDSVSLSYIFLTSAPRWISQYRSGSMRPRSLMSRKSCAEFWSAMRYDVSSSYAASSA